MGRPNSIMMCLTLLAGFSLQACRFGSVRTLSTVPIELGQTVTGALTGTVLDDRKQIIIGATVTLTNRKTLIRRLQNVGISGQFQFEKLEPGTYQLEVSAAGFHTLVLKHVYISAGIESRMRCILWGLSNPNDGGCAAPMIDWRSTS